MALKTYKPITPGQRQLVLVDRSHLWKGKPVKALTEGLTKTGGRNNMGRVSMWHRGGGHKRAYRMVDFKRGKIRTASRSLPSSNMKTASCLISWRRSASRRATLWLPTRRPT